MNVLLHACCAPCSIIPVVEWKQTEIVPTLFFYNPNIHPYREYQKRLEAFHHYCTDEGIDGIVGGQYDLKGYLKKVFDCHEMPRCEVCYKMRLEVTAQQAKERGFEGFSSTLLVSPHQRRDLVIKVGKEVETAYGIPFVIHDWREHYNTGLAKAKEQGLYTQSYCGCIFSEEERYRPKSEQQREEMRPTPGG